ncbi:LRR receptor-like serine/threonine-protein kinase SIK1 [Capsicum annuum]|uniref:LRR receptor-like serine/threonine-protein kinase SIK1 n=1 Tax=Capsicum annuum TaxID=4072 RepID=UPI001FB19969|nr:LRR receptor-like serine/threonine-protein kinase SIK1 [Capsicum annuum]
MKLLGIQYNQLTGSMPFMIFNISRIKVIAFTRNSLSGYLPNDLCNDLPILKGLHLSINKLYGHMPTSLSNCSQLQILSLSINEFEGPIRSEIGRLSNLQKLDLGTNHFMGEIPKEISNLVELEELDLVHNSFSGQLEMENFNISRLRLISLSNNNLSGSLPPNMCFVIPNIEELYLTFTNLVGTIPHSISYLVGTIPQSCASDHISGNQNLFSNLIHSTTLSAVTLANGSRIAVKGIGDVQLLPSISLNSVLFAPECPFNLISVSKLTKRLNCSVTFLAESVVVQDQRTGKTIGTGYES